MFESKAQEDYDPLDMHFKDDEHEAEATSKVKFIDTEAEDRLVKEPKKRVSDQQDFIQRKVQNKWLKSRGRVLSDLFLKKPSNFDTKHLK